MTWHPEILARRQARVLAQIGPMLSRRGFCLVGGTAVALHLGHRRSVDLDWFTLERFDPLNVAQELHWSRRHSFRHRKRGGWDVAWTCPRRSCQPVASQLPVAGWLAPLARRHPHSRPRRPCRHEAFRGGPARRQEGLGGHLRPGRRRSDSLRQMPLLPAKIRRRRHRHLLFSLAYFDDADAERIPRMLWDVRVP